MYIKYLVQTTDGTFQFESKDIAVDLFNKLQVSVALFGVKFNGDCVKLKDK